MARGLTRPPCLSFGALRLSYLALRHLHISCALLSIGLFALRGGLALTPFAWRRITPLRWLPHLNDTVLLASAVALAWQSGQYPFQQSWLTAKVLALLVYIVLGKQALRATPGTLPRGVYFVAALVCAGYIVAVATTRSPTLGL